jgi:hypothetical protein
MKLHPRLQRLEVVMGRRVARQRLEVKVWGVMKR